MVPLPLLLAPLLGIRLLARSELVQGGEGNLEKLWVSLLYLTSLSEYNFFVVVVICLSEVLRLVLNSCLYVAICKRLGGETSYVLPALVKHPVSDAAPLQLSSHPAEGCCREPSLWGLRSFWVFSTQMKIPILIYCAVNKVFCNSRFVFGSVLSLSGLF